MVLVADDHMVNQLDLQELAGTDEVTRHFDVGLGRSAFSARMVVLCEEPSYVQLPIGGSDFNSRAKAKGVLCKIANHSGGLSRLWLVAS